MGYILQTKNLSKNYGGKMAVDNVSLNVKKGDIYGFIGQNGAGKTTLMRMVCGLASPTSGEISLYGSSNLTKQRRKMGATIENPALYPTMTAMENMEAQRLMLGIKNKKECAELLELVGIADTGKKKTKDFSLGMKQRLMLALSLMGNPEFLVLDEPTNGLDPLGIKETLEFIQKLNKTKGITILVSSHILGELEKIATRYGVIHNGKMVDEFSAEELLIRCGENLLINTSDSQKSQEIIKDMLSDAQISLTPENAIRIKGSIKDAGRINQALVESGITVNALIPEGERLEDYFLKLMGGATNA